MRHLAFVTGLRAEARILEDSAKRAGLGPPAVICAGADAGRAEAGATRLIADGARAIVSFGLCGGLDPKFSPGTLILADSVEDPSGRRLGADPALRRRLLGRLQGAGLQPLGGTILGSDRAIATSAEKIQCHRDAAAVAVDMESHGVARAAEKAGIAFLVLRAVADPAGRDLPSAALVATAPDGAPRIAALAGAILRHPWEIAAMLRLSRDARAAFAVLERAAPALLGGA